MQRSKEQKGEIRKPFSAISAKKQRKTIEWERLETRDLFKKIRDTKGTFPAKMGSIKDRNGMDLTEAEDIKNTQKNCTKKNLHDQDNHHGVITHLEPDILECKVK